MLQSFSIYPRYTPVPWKKDHRSGFDDCHTVVARAGAVFLVAVVDSEVDDHPVLASEFETLIVEQFLGSILLSLKDQDPLSRRLKVVGDFV